MFSHRTAARVLCPRLHRRAISPRTYATASDPNYVNIVEVGPRDGLQNENAVIPPALKAELITRLGRAGMKMIEAGSFVSPKWVPQVSGARCFDWPFIIGSVVDKWLAGIRQLPARREVWQRPMAIAGKGGATGEWYSSRSEARKIPQRNYRSRGDSSDLRSRFPGAVSLSLCISASSASLRVQHPSEHYQVNSGHRPDFSSNQTI